MNTLAIINQQEVLGKDFKVYGTPEEPLFLAKDVAEWIDHTNPTEMIRYIDDDEKLNSTIFSAGQNREMSFLTEDGLYEVLMQSRKPIAKQFKSRVKKILKTIRLTGGYAVPTDLPSALRAYADSVDENKRLLAANSQLTVDNAIMKPKAEYFDDLVDRNLLTNFRDTAKELMAPQKQFITRLLDKRYLYRDGKGRLLPYSSRNDGLFEVKENFNQKTGWAGLQTLVTPKGRETFRILFAGIA